MSDGAKTSKKISFEELVEFRDKTEEVAQFLQQQLDDYLKTLWPLLMPKRTFGKYVGSGQSGRRADEAYSQVREKFKGVASKPFGLRAELEDRTYHPNDTAYLSSADNGFALYPWEYPYLAQSKKGKKSLAITSPARWILTYRSDYSLSQLRRVLAGQVERRADWVRDFVINALAMERVISRNPGIARILTDLRFEVKTAKLAELGALPLVTINTCLPSFRPPDELILTAIRFSGVDAFIELIDISTLQTLPDPFRQRIEELQA